MRGSPCCGWRKAGIEAGATTSNEARFSLGELRSGGGYAEAKP